MELINELLGFAVLSGPLWLIVILLPVSIWVAVKVAKHFKSIGARLASGLSIFLLVFLMPFGDEIVGKMYLDHLCATEAGVKVYQAVELPEEYWDEAGEPIFFDSKNGNFTLDGYRIDYKKSVYSPFFHIDNSGYSRVNKTSGQVLGEVTGFMYWGGWLRRNFSFHNTANICDRSREYSRSLVKQIFKRKKL